MSSCWNWATKKSYAEESAKSYYLCIVIISLTSICWRSWVPVGWQARTRHGAKDSGEYFMFFTTSDPQRPPKSNVCIFAFQIPPWMSFVWEPSKEEDCRSSSSWTKLIDYRLLQMSVWEVCFFNGEMESYSVVLNRETHDLSHKNLCSSSIWHRLQEDKYGSRIPVWRLLR